MIKVYKYSEFSNLLLLRNCKLINVWEHFLWLHQRKTKSTAYIKFVHINLCLRSSHNCTLTGPFRCQSTWFHKVCYISISLFLIVGQNYCHIITHCLNFDSLVNSLADAFFDTLMISIFHALYDGYILLLSQHCGSVKFKVFLILTTLFCEYYLDWMFDGITIVICLNKYDECLLLQSWRLNHWHHFAVDEFRGIWYQGKSEPLLIYNKGLLKIYNNVWKLLEQSERVFETLIESKLNFFP